METVKQEENYQYRPLGKSGLGGWLVLIHIGLYVTMIMLLLQLLQYSLPAFGAETWNTLTSKQSEYYHVLWKPIIVFEALYNLTFFLFSIYILFNFYSKKMIFPRLMIIFYSASLIIGIIDLILMYQIPLTRELGNGESIRGIFKSAVACAIWIPYFNKSERVYNTFVK